jgi:hypothetical protein
MTIHALNESQRRAARVVGLAYLVALIPANFAELYVPLKLFVYDNAAETARNVMAHERLFRLGIAANLTLFATDIVLLTALYVVLEPVNRSLALLAAFFRLIETASLVIVAMNDFQVLRVLSGAEYLRGLEADRLQALARLSIDAHGDGYTVALVFFGIGSAVFCHLWLRSRYIPGALAGWGVLSSWLVAACSLAIIVFPDLSERLIPGYFVPIFVFEVAMGSWLLIKGLRPTAPIS